MSYSISDNLKLIFNQLKSNTQVACFSQRFEFTELLETLNATERYLLAASFCKLPWDVGSVHVLAVLQKVRILTATEFISRRMYTNQNIHLILNDFLEQEYELITNLIINASFRESLNYLLKLSTEENFEGWKFFLIILQTLSSSNNKVTGPFMHKYLKSRIKHCASVNNKETVMHLLLTARAFTATDMDIQKNLNSYADWYKANIGEMKYYLKPEEFQTILHLLQECIDYEMEEDYLEIHSTIVISPPVLCSKLVHAYKNKCKQRLKQIKGGLQNVDINESIVIEISN
uniref:Fanconi anaemia group A protein N-terminal domain-containing protein n=1 Tax=Glossina morsitans morsitans TaxID=37546 RepID=A0A1B0FJR6_GLOMM